MFICCPVSLDLMDANWHLTLHEAREEALDWSVDMNGENVIVYRAEEEDDGGYKFRKICSIFA